MALGTAQDASDYEFLITGRSVDMVGDYHMQFAMTLTTDDTSSPDVVPIVQQMVDLLAGSTHFTVSSAQRQHTRTEAITPTA
jgi:hypothetical protein